MSMPINTKVAGVPHRKCDISGVKVGDSVDLVPEPDNKYDANAIKVLHAGVHIGYIPRTDTGACAGETTLFVHEVNPARKWDEIRLANYRPV